MFFFRHDCLNFPKVKLCGRKDLFWRRKVTSPTSCTKGTVRFIHTVKILELLLYLIGGVGSTNNLFFIDYLSYMKSSSDSTRVLYSVDFPDNTSMCTIRHILLTFSNSSLLYQYKRAKMII